MSIRKWRSACSICSTSLNKLGTTVVVATHDLHLLTRDPARRDAAARPRPDRRSDRRAAPSAEAGRHVKGGVRKFGAAERGLLPEGRLAGPMPWVIAIMMFLTVLAAAAGLGLGQRRRAARRPDRRPRHHPDRRGQSGPRARPRPPPPAAAIEQSARRGRGPPGARGGDPPAARALARRRRARERHSGARLDRRRSDAGGPSRARRPAPARSPPPRRPPGSTITASGWRRSPR